MAVFLPSCRAGLFRLLYALGASAEDSEDLIFLHDQQFFAVNLDYRSGILAEQYAVAFFYCQGDGLAFFKLSSSSGDNDAFLGFFFCGVRDDDSTTNGFRLLDPADYDAVMKRGQLLCHATTPFKICSKMGFNDCWFLRATGRVASTHSYRVLIMR